MIILEKIICIAQDKPFICVVTKSIRKGLIEPTVFNKTFSYGFSILNDVFEDSIMKKNNVNNAITEQEGGRKYSCLLRQTLEIND